MIAVCQTIQPKFYQFPYRCTHFRSIYRRDYSNNENKNKFLDSLKILSFAEVYNKKNTDEALNQFLDIFILIYDLHFPKIRTKIKQRKSHWLSKGIKLSTKTKRNLYLKCRKTSDIGIRNKYVTYRRIVKRSIILSQKLSNIKTILCSTNKAKFTWNIIRQRTGSKNKVNTITSIQDMNRKICTHPTEIANVFNKYYVNLTKMENNIDVNKKDLIIFNK